MLNSSIECVQDNKTIYEVCQCDITHYLSVEKYGTVQIVQGPSKGKAARVMSICLNGNCTLWDMKDGHSLSVPESRPTNPNDPDTSKRVIYKYLNAYWMDFDIVDWLCKGDSVESLNLQKPLLGIVLSVKDGLVTFEQGYHANGTKVSAGKYIYAHGLTYPPENDLSTCYQAD